MSCHVARHASIFEKLSSASFSKTMLLTFRKNPFGGTGRTKWIHSDDLGILRDNILM
jgi:hypothetical protein